MARFSQLDSILPVNSLPLGPWTVAYVCLLADELGEKVKLTPKSTMADIRRMREFRGSSRRRTQRSHS